MKRGFRGAPRPLLPAMLLVATTNPNAGQEHHAVTQSQPSSSTLPVPSTSSPPVQSPPPIPASIPTPTLITMKLNLHLHHLNTHLGMPSPVHNTSYPHKNSSRDKDYGLIYFKKKFSVDIKGIHSLAKEWKSSMISEEENSKKSKDANFYRRKHRPLLMQSDEDKRKYLKEISPEPIHKLKTYMMNYLKNQGTWKLSQLKNLSFNEVKKEFDKLVKHVESFAPINFEATKASLKRFCEELQTKTTKRLKDDEAKDAEPAKKSGKRRKQMARKGFHTA
ncbi:hypothetical protein Tco_1201954 [Tanacetum coccineum]